MASTISTSEAMHLAPAERGAKSRGKKRPGPYPYWFYIPAAIIYAVFFMIPTISSFYFSFTRWDLFTSTWIGLKNYQTFFHEQALITGLGNTLIYAVITSGLKVVLGMALALLLTSKIITRGYLRSVIFFPVLVSTIGVGLTFTVLMNPEHGLINNALGVDRHQRAGLADQPEPGAVLGRPGRCLEGRRSGHRHLHRRPGLDSERLLRGRTR